MYGMGVDVDMVQTNVEMKDKTPDLQNQPESRRIIITLYA
jgi:hypothetical protein